MRTPSTSTRLRIAYLGAAGLDTWWAGHPSPLAHRARALTKPALMPLLAGSLVTNPRAVSSPLRRSTLAGQAGGWGGDVALMLPGTTPFLIGVGSFGIGHLAYLSGLLRHQSRRPWRADRSARGVARAWAISAPALALLARRRQPELGAPVLGYATLLATVAAASGHLDEELSASTRRLTQAGGLLFMASDLLLAVRQFVLTDPPADLERAVMATYAAAQLLISEGAARA